MAEFVNEKPKITIGGKKQRQLDNKNTEDRFNFVPRTDGCPGCGSTQYAYQAFNMRDGRITVMWICRKCGKEAMMAKVHFSEERTEAQTIVETIMEAFAKENPSVAACVESAKISARINNGKLNVQIDYYGADLIRAKMLSRKRNELMCLFDVAMEVRSSFNAYRIVVYCDGKPIDAQPTDEISEEARAYLINALGAKRMEGEQ